MVFGFTMFKTNFMPTDAFSHQLYHQVWNEEAHTSCFHMCSVSNLASQLSQCCGKSNERML